MSYDVIIIILGKDFLIIKVWGKKSVKKNEYLYMGGNYQSGKYSQAFWLFFKVSLCQNEDLYLLSLKKIIKSVYQNLSIAYFSTVGRPFL